MITRKAFWIDGLNGDQLEVLETRDFANVAIGIHRRGDVAQLWLTAEGLKALRDVLYSVKVIETPEAPEDVSGPRGE